MITLLVDRKVLLYYNFNKNFGLLNFLYLIEKKFSRFIPNLILFNNLFRSNCNEKLTSFKTKNAFFLIPSKMKKIRIFSKDKMFNWNGFEKVANFYKLEEIKKYFHNKDKFKCIIYFVAPVKTRLSLGFIKKEKENKVNIEKNHIFEFPFSNFSFKKDNLVTLLNFFLPEFNLKIIKSFINKIYSSEKLVLDYKLNKIYFEIYPNNIEVVIIKKLHKIGLLDFVV